MRGIRRGVAGLMAMALTAMPLQAAQAPVPDDIPIALLVDLSNGQTLFAREAERRFVPASVTKVMTAYTAFEMVEAGELELGRQVLYTRALEREWYREGSTMFLRAGDTPTIAQLLMGITTVSGNDASMALALDAKGSLDAWLAQMNANAAALGMADTHFGSPNGYPDGGETYTTAQDLALLGRAVTEEHAGLYQRFFGNQQLSWGGFTQQNYDPVTGRVAGADGIKTGMTNEAGFTFLGSATRQGRRLVMVLAGAPTQDERDNTARALLEWGYDAFAPHIVVPADSLVGTARVQGGNRPDVGLWTGGEDLVLYLPDGADTGDIAATISYRGPIDAPFAAKDRIASLLVKHGGETLLEAPLYAGETVSDANLFQRIGNAFADWFG